MYRRAIFHSSGRFPKLNHRTSGTMFPWAKLQLLWRRRPPQRWCPPCWTAILGPHFASFWKEDLPACRRKVELFSLKFIFYRLQMQCNIWSRHLVLPSKFLDLWATNPTIGKNIFQTPKIFPTNSAQIFLRFWPHVLVGNQSQVRHSSSRPAAVTASINNVFISILNAISPRWS